MANCPQCNTYKTVYFRCKKCDFRACNSCWKFKYTCPKCKSLDGVAE